MNNLTKFFTICGLFLLVSCGSNTPKKQTETTTTIEQNSVKLARYELTDSIGAKSKMIGTHSAGKATSGEMIADRFEVINKVTKPIVILEISSNCGCLKVDYSKEPMKAEGVKILNYTYDTRGKSGQQYSEVTIKTNVGNYILLVDLLIK